MFIPTHIFAEERLLTTLKKINIGKCNGIPVNVSCYPLCEQKIAKALATPCVCSRPARRELIRSMNSQAPGARSLLEVQKPRISQNQKLHFNKV